MDRLQDVGGLVVRADGATFVIKNVDRLKWDKHLTINHPNARWINYDALLVVTKFSILKLEWVHQNYKPFHDSIVQLVKAGEVSSLSELCSEMSKYANRYGATVRLEQTKLEYYYD